MCLHIICIFHSFRRHRLPSQQSRWNRHLKLIVNEIPRFDDLQHTFGFIVTFCSSLTALTLSRAFGKKKKKKPFDFTAHIALFSRRENNIPTNYASQFVYGILRFCLARRVFSRHRLPIQIRVYIYTYIQRTPLCRRHIAYTRPNSMHKLY